MAVGQASAFAPDYGKGKTAANRIFALFDRVPEIDTFSEDGAKPVSKNILFILFKKNKKSYANNMESRLKITETGIFRDF